MNIMFYSLKEVAEKLNKTEDQVKEIVREGKLREFREGPNSLFKVDEVEALMSDPSIMPPEEPAAPLVQKPDEDKISFAPEPATSPEPPETPEPVEIPETIETPELAMTPEMAETPEPLETPEPVEIPEPVETPELAMIPEMAETPEPPETPEPIEIPEPIETPELAMTPEMAEIPEPPETPEPIEIPEPTEIPELAMTPEIAETPETPETPEPIEIPEPTETPELAMTPEMAETPEQPETPAPPEGLELTDTSEPVMTPEPTETPLPSDSLELIDTSGPAITPESSDSLGLIDTSGMDFTTEPIDTSAVEGDLSSADTAIVGEGTDTFEEMDTGLQATDDTVIEAKDTTSETSLQEIEEDVNLDSFGSGSGLLDLSLQADDTSLGGILDEIYAPEAGAEGQQVGETTGSAVEMAAEAAQILPDEFTAPAAAAVPALAQAYAEPEPDTISNAFGYTLILSFVAIIYTAVVAVTGLSDVVPAGIREKVQGIIWYIAGGAVVVALLIIGAGFMLGGKPATGEKKKKVKKAKKGKKAKEAPAAEEEETA